MKSSHLWIVFALCAAVWLAIFAVLPPAMSGTDVFIFREAGWNLAAHGTFSASGLMYMPDLAPRLYAHYTPIQPLLFAAYASVFPRNAYAGTIFSLLIGLLAATVAMACVLRQPVSRLRIVTALATCLLPIVFITPDRPEAIGLVLFCVAIAVASSAQPKPMLTGIAIALAFMAHPFAAIVAAFWISAIFLARNWSQSNRWFATAGQVAVTAISAAIPIAAVAAIFYKLDPGSLRRFATHALGMHSGVSTAASKGGWTKAIHFAAFGGGGLRAFTYLASLASVFLLLSWALRRRAALAAQEWLLVAVAVFCTLVSIGLFSFQYNYIVILAFMTPLALLLAVRERTALVAPALALLLYAIAVKVPLEALNLAVRAEQGPSYRAALAQPTFLRSQLGSADAIVGLEGESYDIFKPEFAHMIGLVDAEDKDGFKDLAAVANCYDGYHSTGNELRPLPEKIDPKEFHLIQADPMHMWITLFGRRAMRAQWGYGCDLYVRNGLPSTVSPQP